MKSMIGTTLKRKQGRSSSKYGNMEEQEETQMQTDVMFFNYSINHNIISLLLKQEFK